MQERGKEEEKKSLSKVDTLWVRQKFLHENTNFPISIEKGRFVTYSIAGGAISFQPACSNIQSASRGSQERQKGWEDEEL